MADPLGQLMAMPRNPARAPGVLEQLVMDATVNPLWDVAKGVGAAASGYGTSPEAGAGLMAAMGLMTPMRLPTRIPNPIRAYHGSPHDFSKFDLAKIGTGEGNTAYGHGLYFAENPATALSYKEKLGSQNINSTARFYLQRSGGNKDKALAALDADYAKSSDKSGYDSISEQIKRGAGRMYEVDIHARPEQFLDWDKPSNQQPEEVNRLLTELGITPQSRYLDTRAAGAPTYGADVYQNLENSLFSKHSAAKYGSPDILGPPSDVNELASKSIMDMANAGIPGIKYFDQGSRGQGQGTSNYVVFTPEIIEIMRKYGLSGASAGPLGALMFGDQAQAAQ